MQVAVFYGMLPKDLQERVLDKCAVSWDKVREKDAGDILMRVKEEVKNIAKSRREMHGPKPMEVDRVTGLDWGCWADWSCEEEQNIQDDEGDGEEAR
jgi:hypothetical protein